MSVDLKTKIVFCYVYNSMLQVVVLVMSSYTCIQLAATTVEWSKGDGPW